MLHRMGVLHQFCKALNVADTNARYRSFEWLEFTANVPRTREIALWKKPGQVSVGVANLAEN